MARYINKVSRLQQVSRNSKIAQRLETSILESSLPTRSRCVQAVCQCNQRIPCHRLYSQVRNMQTTSETATSSWNDWLPETEEVYLRLKAMAEKDGWTQVRNTNTDPKSSQYMFSRVTTANGPVIHYALFVQKEKMKLCGVCQFGEEAQGPHGLAHGGASATMHDVITAVLSQKAVTEMIVTASLTVNFKKPTPLRTAILMEGNIDKFEGHKIFLQAYLKSPEGTTVYSNSTALFINMESKLRAMQEQLNSAQL